MLKLFRERFDKITETRDESERGRVDIKAMNELTKEGKIIKRCSSIIGPVPGVEVGDRFRYRVELVIVGLHKHNERGIDTTTDSSGLKKVATCVVANSDHFDKINDPNILTYIGEGGKPRGKTVGNPNPKLDSKPSDQELKGGNLALLESKMSSSPVRVVKGFKVNRMCPRRGRTVERTEYIYDGLYEVKSCEKKQGLMKNWIFEFELFRCPGQPDICLKGCKR
ncbi:histone-lysine N-methyltransferase, H3 lysine-9 specific SUVH5-like [Spinacia oleracea]|uniref:Histone-lysine N-methyltransferase, H3 lysine-9 specific SUVH5-like n=1 Tax=Spinacia oleracea TaxID=3562 RepID=A0A9R0K2R9_SPIOL|nr:histone-lysine N-methyltransferase, H3 lysine-9 specific SUVH5-like [Spinacia oleracea]